MSKRTAIFAAVYADLYTTRMNEELVQFMQKKKVIIGGIFILLLFIPLLFFTFKQAGSPPELSTSPTPLAGIHSQNVHMPNPTPSVATAILSFKKQSATSTAVLVDTDDKAVSAVQLSISFDPAILGNITIYPGNFFKQALVLINKIDYSTGTIFYAAVVPPSGLPQQGKGVVALLTYNFTPGAINPTILQFLPNTKVTARGVENSILRQATSINIAASDN